MLRRHHGQLLMFNTSTNRYAKTQKTLPFIRLENYSSAHVPRAPHRRLENDSSLALGIGRTSTRIPLLVEKPIVRSPRPSEFNKSLRADINAANSTCNNSKESSEGRLPNIVCDDHIQRLSVKRLYTSTTREATEKAALPTAQTNAPSTTLEIDADPVRCRTLRYAPWPSQWQLYAREWDAMQLRKSSENEECKIKLPQIRNSTTRATPDLNYRQAKTENTFLRPMPGYGGFIPRHAVESCNHTDTVSDSMCSTARGTYRKFPAYEYKVLEHAHKGPFSKTVTMTHPLNPFNKVEHQRHIY